MTGRFTLAALVFCAALAVPAAAARAEVAIEGAGVFGNGSASAGAALSLGLLHVPLTPLSADLTVAVPFNGGYATTLDARLGFAGTTIGAGAGFGTLGAANRTGAIYDALIAQGIAPHTALQVRVYFGNARTATIFAGVRFAF
jgi:hypothetical protein